MKRVLRWVGVTLLVSISLVATGLAWLITTVRGNLTPPENPEGQVSIASYARGEPEPAGGLAGSLLPAFNWEDIADPPKSARPWTRWWWPRGAVELEVLEQQLHLLDAANFGGAEVQASAMGIAAVSSETELAAVWSFDTPVFYDKLRGLLQSVEQQGWQIDLTHLSGWPPGGPQILLQNSLTELVYGETEVTGGGQITLDLPTPRPPANKYVLAANELFMGDFVNFAVDHARARGIRSYARVLDSGEWIYFFASQSAAAESVTLTLSTALADARQAGANTIDVEVLPPLVNGFIDKARDEDPRYPHMLCGEGSAFGAGLIGPVRLVESRSSK